MSLLRGSIDKLGSIGSELVETQAGRSNEVGGTW